MKPLSPDLRHFIQAMPKAEIHIHLEGAIAPGTVLELARRHDLLHRLPAGDVTGLQRWYTFTDFRHFVKIYLTIQDLLRTAADFELIAYECGADMAAQNIRYRELTVTPVTHTDFQNKAITIDDILAGLEAGRRRARADFGVEMRWVFDIPRNLSYQTRADGRYDPQVAERTADFAIAGMSQGVVGFGLGGYEVGAPPEPFAHAFARATAAGLASVPHAGETMGPESVWGAVTALEAQRIGHGVRAAEDPALLALLKERQIPLEVNLTSNICLHVYEDIAAHPFPGLDHMGLIVTVNSDDPPLFNTTLLDEYAILATEFGYSKADIARIARNAYLVAAVDRPTRDRLLAEFDAWCALELT